MNRVNVHVEAIRDFAEKHIVPVPAETAVCEVTVDLTSEVLKAYGSELFSQIENSVQLRGGSLSFNEDELQSYLGMLVRLRVDYVNGKRTPFRPTDFIAVPSFVSVVLQNLGIVYHLELGLELRPVLKDSQTSWSDDERMFMERMSRAIVALGNYGLEYAKGYERSKDGAFDFMTMSVIKDRVMGVNREVHPVFALLSSTLKLQGIEQVLSPRIHYGSTQHLCALVKHLAVLKA